MRHETLWHFKAFNFLVKSVHYVTDYVIICRPVVTENARVNSAVKPELLDKIQANLRLKF